jgi:hypothetical protein
LFTLKSGTALLDGLNQPTSFEIVGNTAYMVTITGEVWKIENFSVPPGKK